MFPKVNAGCLIRSIVDDGIHGSKRLCGQDNPSCRNGQSLERNGNPAVKKEKFAGGKS